MSPTADAVGNVALVMLALTRISAPHNCRTCDACTAADSKAVPEESDPTRTDHRCRRNSIPIPMTTQIPNEIKTSLPTLSLGGIVKRLQKKFFLITIKQPQRGRQSKPRILERTRTPIPSSILCFQHVDAAATLRYHAGNRAPPIAPNCLIPLALTRVNTAPVFARSLAASGWRGSR